MTVVLLMLRDGSSPRSFQLKKDSIFIGRREDCDLRIAVGDVSRKHARIQVIDEVVSIEDLGSSNGTYVNGDRVKNIQLVPGDTIQIGPVTFILQVDGVPAPQDAQPISRGPKRQPAPDASGANLDEDEAMKILELDDSKT
jgi:pSer/pThr/pTyr-binding forkhead associated (FHA) protein